MERKPTILLLVVSLFLPAWTAGTKSQSVGSLWTPDVRLTSNSAPSQLSFNFAWSIAADHSGRVHVVWYDSRDGTDQIYYKRSTDGGRTWASDLRLSSNPFIQQHPGIAVWEQNVYVIWHHFGNHGVNLHFRRSTNGGTTWQAEVALTGDGSSAHPSIAASGAFVQVVWGDTRSGNAEIYTRRSTDYGATWAPQRRISDLPFESWVSTVALSGRNIWITWVDYRDANEEEYFRRSTDGGATFGPVIRLTNQPADSWAPSIAVLGNAVHVVWFDRRVSRYTDSDVEDKLDEAMNLLRLPPQPPPPRDPSIYYLQPFLKRVQDKLYKIQAAAPNWVAGGGDPKQLESMIKEFERRMKIWTLGWDIFYKQSSDGGSTWGPDLRLTTVAGASLRPSIAATGTNVHIVWFDGSNGGAEIYYKYSSDGGITWGPDTRLTKAPGDSMHPSIAVTKDAVHVVWFDQRDGNSEIYYKRKSQ